MASLNEPDFRSLGPGPRYAARMGTATGLTSGPTQNLPQRDFEQPDAANAGLAGQVPPQHGDERVAGHSSEGAPPPQRIPRWLVRTELFLRVMLRMYIGLAVCYAPWSHTFWDRNPFFAQFPALSVYAANGAIRGMVSGLGLLNLWFAFHDALHHREG